MLWHRVRRRWRKIRREAVDGTGWTATRFRRMLTTSAGRPGTDHHVLIAPPGAGNIGDQAMVEAFIAAADRPVTVVTRSTGDFVFPDDLAPRVRLHALTSLFFGRGRAHLEDVRTLGSLLNNAATVSIIGADMMDGAYVLRHSIRRASLAAAAASSGFDTTIVGFSWNSNAAPPALAALRRAGKAGARLLVRDPQSAARVRDAGVPGVVLTADIVFGDDRTDAAAAAAILDGVPEPFVLVNASGLIARRVDQTDDYVRVIDHLRAHGLHTLLVPHVLRSTADDLAACRAVLEAAGADAVTLVHQALTPSAIRSLADRATLTVTGRMHLAVMSLSRGVPAITLATQGKVEGLMSTFEWPELCVTPRPGMSEDITGIIDAVLSDVDSGARIRAGAERARSAARANIERICSPGAATTSREGLPEAGDRDDWDRQRAPAAP